MSNVVFPGSLRTRPPASRAASRVSARARRAAAMLPEVRARTTSASGARGATHFLPALVVMGWFISQSLFHHISSQDLSLRDRMQILGTSCYILMIILCTFFCLLNIFR